MWRSIWRGKGGLLGAVVALALLLTPAAALPTTPAGTVVTHSCQLRYGAAPTTVSSNETRVTVGGICDLTIAPPRNAVSHPGQAVDFLHTISNQGNAPDRFLLTAVHAGGLPDGASPCRLEFYDKDGKTKLPLDTTGAALTGTVAAGGTLDVILRVTPPSGSEGRQMNLVVKAVSQAVPTRSSSLNDQVAIPVSSFADPTKSVSPAGAVLPGAALTYTIAFATSDLPATGIVVTDQLDPLLNFTAGSAAFSTGSVGGTASFDPVTRTLTFRLPNLAASTGAAVTFQATVRADAPFDAVILNTANLSSDQNPVPQASNTTRTPVRGQPLQLIKGAGVSSAEAGDIIPYTIQVKNNGAVPLNNVTVHDAPPRGFRYLKGSSLLDGSTFADPTPSGGGLFWNLGTLAPGETRVLVYRMAVSTDAPVGNNQNQAFAFGTTPGGTSTASPNIGATVLIRASILGSKAIIMGRVFIDPNGNGLPDPGETGVAGVRIYLDDGSFSFTDPLGQYTFTGVSAGNHVVKIDRSTLPRNLHPVPFNTAFAGVGWSQFITVPFGGPARGDFALKEITVGPEPPAPPAPPVPPPPAPISPAGVGAGPAKKIVVNPDRVDMPADAKSVIPFTVEILNAEGKRVAGESLVTVRLGKGEIREPDADPKQPGHQVRVHDGIGVFHVRAAKSPGADPITIQGAGVQQTVDLFFSSPLRDWILVGIGSLTVGGRSVSSHVEPTDKDDRFDSGLFHEERLSFFTRGKILGKYLVTAAYDSGKERREGLFQEIDPEKYYPVYGDASDIGYEAPSRGKLYVKVEAGRSYLIGGDYRTDLSENEFSRYDRALNGVKLEVNEPGVILRGFQSSNKEVVTRDEFPGNGTSGYFFLSRTPVFENSERVRIETRDRYHSERVLSVVEKIRYADYSIDYGAGTILFKEPVPALDKNMNPITIVVNYQSERGGVERQTYGGRAVVGSRAGSWFGGTAVVEEQSVKNNTLYGLDGGLKLLGDQIALKGEGAVSENLEHGRGSAWKAEAFTHPAQEFNLGGYYRKVDADFYNPSMTGSELGTTKYGGKADYRLPSKTLLTAESFVEKSEITGIRLFGNQAGFAHKFSLWDTEAGYKRIEEEAGGRNGVSDIVYAGVKGPLTAKLDATLRREQLLAPSLVADYQTKTYLRLDYRISERTRAFVAEEYQEGAPKQRQATLVGMESKLSEKMRLSTGYQLSSGTAGSTSQGNVDLNTKVYEERGLVIDTRTGYQIQDSLSAQRGQAILGLNSRYEVSKGLLFSSSLERIETVQGHGGEGTAFTLAGEYLRAKELKVTGRYEIKSAPGELTSLYAAQAAYKLNESLTLVGKSSLWTRDADAGDDVVYDGYVGTAWRPIAGNPLHLLTLARFKIDDKDSVPGGPHTKSLVLSAEPTFRMNKRWTLQGKYAGKLSFESSGPVGVQSYTDLALAGVSYDLAEKWELTVYGKLTSQYEAGLHDFGVTGTIGYRVYRNVVLMTGYNYARLDDRDLTGETFQGQGPFFGVKVKFDEEMFEHDEAEVRPIKEPVRAEVPKAAPPAPPVVPVVPAVAIVGVREDIPLQISGSAELLTLLVNGEKPRLPSTEVNLTREILDSVELSGGKLKRPIRFRTSVEKPGEVKGWHFGILDAQGRGIRALKGEGAPPEQLVWNGETDGPALVKGEIYQYQMELVYKDGSYVATPRGLFGVSRKEAVLLSLSGGAFVFEKWNLTDQARRLLKEAARVLRANPKEKVIVEGHTDGIGTVPYNVGLSKKRCDSAANYLVRQEGIPEARIIRRWYGKSRPIADNATTPGRRLNRRVEILGDFGRNVPTLPDRFRAKPFVVINGTPLPLDPDGRFATTIPADVGKLKVEMGDSSGRGLATVLPVPSLDIAAPTGARVVPFGVTRAGYKVDTDGHSACTLAAGTDPGNRVELDGKLLVVDGKGGFSTELSLVRGEKVFGMVVRNGAGCSRLLNLKVRTAPQELRGQSEP
ncbi:OmpA family protein [Geomesophilobacter sediminis]|nr:OmpA family protein [Geomesophilobacter sediminis]